MATTEDDILFRLLSHCIFCSAMLEVDEGPIDELKTCPLGHGIYYVQVDCCYEHIAITFEPEPFLISETGDDDEIQQRLFQLCSTCVLCNEPLVVSLDLPDVKECPLGHGAMYVYDQGDGYQVINFESVIRVLDENWERSQDGEWYMTGRGYMKRRTS